MWKSLKGLNAYRNIILRQHINATNGVPACYMALFATGQIRPGLIENDTIFKIPSISFNRNFHTALAIYKAKNLPGDNSDKPQEPADDSNNDNNKNNKDTNEKIKAIVTKLFFWILTFYSIVTFMSLLLKSKTDELETASKYITWNEFIHYILPTGEIKEIIIRPNLDLVTIVLHEGAIIRGRPAPSTTYHMAIADSAKFEQRLRQIEERMGVTEGVAIVYDRSSDLTSSIITILFIAAIIGLLAQRMKGFKSPIGMDIFSQMGRAKFTLVDPFDGGRGVLFKDVAGLKEAKQEVLEFVDYLKSPHKYQKLGAKVPRGALLLGPPGCGKTLLAKAVATEAQVPFLSMNGSEFIEMIGGLGAARVRDLFREGYKRAPCIIYIDEIDAIGRHRSDNAMHKARSGESEQTLNQLLVEMDGVASKEGVLTLASTNRADILDKALLRPGRFDRHILIDLPTLQERKEIFENYLATISLDFEPIKYSSRLAWLTPGFSGADIANVCNEAALHAARNSQAKVQAKNLEYAVERLVGGTEKRSHALSAEEREILAYHEAGHALACWLLPNIVPLLKVTIVPRTNLTLGFTQLAPSEQKLYSKEELFDKMCVALGGRAAENLIFKRVTTGAQNDLTKVTQIAYSKIKKFGMNDVIGPMYITDAEEVNSYAKPFSKALQQTMDHEVRKSVSRAYEITEDLMKANRGKLEKLARALLEKETLNYDEIVELIGPPPNKEKRVVEYSFESNG